MLSLISIEAQEIVYPQNNSTNVPLMPIIHIKLDAQIDSATTVQYDSSSITVRFPLKDSNVVTSGEMPTVLLYEKNANLDSTLAYTHVKGYYNLIDDTTLHFQPIIELKPGTEYNLSLLGLKYIKYYAPSGTYDTLTFILDTISFKTEDPLHLIDNSKLIRISEIKCDKIIYAYSNIIFDSTHQYFQDLIEIYKIDSLIIINDTTYIQHKTKLQTNIEIDSINPKKIRAKINDNLEVGEAFIIKSRPSIYNGDTTTDISKMVYYNNETYVNIMASLKDSIVNYDSTKYYIEGYPKNTYIDGDTIFVKAKDSFENNKFLYWTNPYTNDTIVEKDIIIPVICGESYHYIAHYNSNLDSVQVQIDSVSNGTVYLIDLDGDTLGNAGVYTLPVNFPYYLLVSMDSLYTIEGITLDADYPVWINTGGDEFYALSGNINNFYIQFTSTGGEIVTLTPFGTITFSPTQYKLRTSIKFDDVGGDQSFYGNYITHTYPLTNVKTTTNPEEVNDVQCIIDSQYEDCWEIYGYKIEEASPINNVEVKYLDVPTTSVTIPRGVWTTALETIVTFYIRKKGIHTLTVSTNLEKKSYWPGDIGIDKDVTIKVEIIRENTPKILEVYYTNSNQNPLIIQNIKCNSRVRLTAMYNLKETGFSFLGWSDDPGFTYPIIPFTDLLKETFEFVLYDDEYFVDATFKEHFRLREVGVYQSDINGDISLNYFGTAKWTNTKEVINIEINRDLINNNINTDDGYETTIYLKFNDPCDENSFDKSFLAEKGWRPDGNTVNVPIQYVAYNFEKNINLFKVNQDGYLWKFIVKLDDTKYHANYAIPKGTKFRMPIKDVKNTDNPPLLQYNPTTFNGMTELPGLQAKLTGYYIAENNGNFEPDVGWLEGNLEVRHFREGFRKRIMSDGYQYELIDDDVEFVAKDDVEFNTWIYDFNTWETGEIFKYNELEYNDVVSFNISTFDDDGGDDFKCGLFSGKIKNWYCATPFLAAVWPKIWKEKLPDSLRVGDNPLQPEDPYIWKILFFAYATNWYVGVALTAYVIWELMKEEWRIAIIEFFTNLFGDGKADFLGKVDEILEWSDYLYGVKQRHFTDTEFRHIHWNPKRTIQYFQSRSAVRYNIRYRLKKSANPSNNEYYE